jgi:uncharacterized surface protein with fasciclin (FAS1) repeats
MTERSNLIDTIAKADMFSTFSRLLAASGVDETILAGGDFTIFAPTNDAFAKFTDRQMEELSANSDHGGLKTLLSYHVVPGKLFAPNFSGQRSRTSLTGDDVKFSDIGTLKVNNSNIQARNIEAANGVIHAIDTVLAPPMRSVATSSIL